MLNQAPTRLAQGYTLIETLTVVAVLLVTIGIAVPGFSNMLSRNQQVTLINQFSTSLAQARYYAINHSKRIVMCPSKNQSECTGGFSWHEGYITFIDNDMNRQRNQDEEIIAISQQQSRTSVSILTSKGRSKITFHPSGRSPGSNTTIRFCGINDIFQSKALILSNTGRARLSEKMPRGEKISCI